MIKTKQHLPARNKQPPQQVQQPVQQPQYQIYFV
jgi:hypothetical protein